MIIDKLENWEFYHYGPVWEQIFEFLISLTSDSEEKRYNIQGDDIFAEVSKYNTRPSKGALLETHRKYADIHVVLTESERIECSTKDKLVVDIPYDGMKDVEFYKYIDLEMISIKVIPGIFALFFPQDAHMPGLIFNKTPESVKKVVVKVRVELLT